LTDAVRSFNAQMLQDGSTVSRLLGNTDRGLGTLAVSIATPMIMDKMKVVGEDRLGEHRSAFVTHSAMHEHDRLPRSSVPDFQFHAIDFGTLHCLPSHLSTSLCSANHIALEEWRLAEIAAVTRVGLDTGIWSCPRIQR